MVSKSGMSGGTRLSCRHICMWESGLCGEAVMLSGWEPGGFVSSEDTIGTKHSRETFRAFDKAA